MHRELHYLGEKEMDAQDFRLITHLYAPWLLKLIASKVGRHRTPNQAERSFEILLSQKIESIVNSSWNELDLIHESVPSHTSSVTILRHYTVVWRQTKEDTFCHTGTDKLAGTSVDSLLRLVLGECNDGDTVWMEAVVETIYTLDTSSIESPKHKFVIYPCMESDYMQWVDQNKDSINQVLAQRGLILSSYSVVAQKQ